MKLSHGIVLESQSARRELLAGSSNEKALEALNKAKSLVLALWQGVGYATTEQVAEYYGTAKQTIQNLLDRSPEEFDQEVKTVTGRELQQLKLSLSVSPNSPKITIWTACGMTRAGLMLTESDVARCVRDVVLNIVEKTNLFVEQSKPLEPSPMDLYQQKNLEMGIELAKLTNDARALQVYSTQLQNLIQRIGAMMVMTTAVAALPEAKPLTVSEVLEGRGYHFNSVKVQNSLGQIGKLVKKAYIQERNENPLTIPKALGSNHKSKDIQLYPEDYFERICAIAEGYWINKGLM